MQGTIDLDICVICYKTIDIPLTLAEEEKEEIEPKTSQKDQSKRQINYQTNFLQPSASLNDENQQKDVAEVKESLKD